MPPPNVDTELRPRHIEGHFIVLFGLALGLHVVLPLLKGFRWLEAIVGAGLLAVFAYAGWLTVERHRARSVFLGSLALTVATTLSLLASPGPDLHLVWIACQAGFSFLVTGMLIAWTIGRERVTADAIFAALSAYFLMAFAWAMTYALVDGLSPGSFSTPLAAQLQDAFYFSFVTITTLGYGDITPVAPLGRALATTEALVGQIYMVVLVARLVALWSPVTRGSERGPLGTRRWRQRDGRGLEQRAVSKPTRALAVGYVRREHAPTSPSHRTLPGSANGDRLPVTRGRAGQTNRRLRAPSRAGRGGAQARADRLWLRRSSAPDRD